MKKSYLALGLVAAVAMSSCSNDEPVPGGNNNQSELAKGYEPVKLSMTTSTADVEVSGARTRGTGTVGSMDPNQNIWQYEDIYVLMTSTQTRKHYPYWETEATWGFTSALGNGPFLFDQFDGSFWARPADSNKKGNVSVSVLDYTIDRNEWWWGGSIDRFYPLSGGSQFFAYYIDDAVAESKEVDLNFKETQDGEEKTSGREHSHPYPVLNKAETDDAYSVKFNLDGSQDLMAGYATIPVDGYAAQDKGFSARSARQGVVPQINMKHLLSRLTFEVVKGGKNFDRVTLKGIKVESKDQGDMIVAIDPEKKQWEEVGKITWNEDSKEAFALKQIAEKYAVEGNGVAGTCTVDEDVYDVYYNIYDGLYANIPQTTTEEVAISDTDVDENWFEDDNLKADAKITVDGETYDVKEKEVEGVKSYYYEKTTTTTVKTTIAENDVTGLVPVNSKEAGKAQLVEFAEIDLKNFGLEEKQSKSVGEAMFVAPGETSYTLTLEMAYLVRDGEAEELANLEQAVADAEADVYAMDRALKVAKAIAEKRVEAQKTAYETFKTDSIELARLEAAVSTAKTAMDQAKDALTVAEATGTTEEIAAAKATFEEKEGEYETAQNAVAAYMNDTYTPAEQALNDAIAAVEAANAAVVDAEEDLAAAKAAELIAKDNLAKFEPVVEEMTQDLTVKLPQGEFLAGNSYNIRVTIYGYEPAEVEVKLTPWLDGGHFDVGGDDDNVENGDYYPNGNHQDNEDDVVEDGE